MPNFLEQFFLDKSPGNFFWKFHIMFIDINMSKDSSIGDNRCSEEAGKSQRNPEYSDKLRI